MKTQLKDAMKVAMKEKNRLALDTIRTLLSAIQYEEMQKGTEEIPETAILAIIKNEVKKRKEGIEFEEKAGRSEQVQALQTEIAVLENFLPTQLDGQALERILKEFKDQNSSANMGDAMKMLKDTYPSQYDGKEASSIAKSIFS